jgi:hypothetical protein
MKTFQQIKNKSQYVKTELRMVLYFNAYLNARKNKRKKAP